MIDEELINEREHAEILRKLDIYEKEVRSQLNYQVRIYNSREYHPIWLSNLIPGDHRQKIECIRCRRDDLPIRIDGQCEACYQFFREENE